MSSKQKQVLTVAAVLVGGWLLLGLPSPLPRGDFYPYMGRAGGAGPGQTGSGGRSPGQ